MKLRLPKALTAALMTAMVAAGNAYAVDDTNMQWANNSGVFKWTGSGWQVGTLISGHEITDWENGYTWADSTGPTRGGTSNNMGPILLIDGTSGNTTGNKDTSDNGGVVAINGATANVNLGGWGGNVYVEEGCDLRAYLENGQWDGGYRLKSMNAQKYSLVANGKLTFTSAVSFDGNSANQKWYIGNAGSITFTSNNTFTVNKPLALEVEVHGADLHGQTVANRSESRTVISGPVTVDSGGSVTITYKNDVTGATISNVYPTTLSSTGLTAGFTKETLVWKGGEGKKWTNGADGWYIQGDADQTDTGFINGDNVVFSSESEAENVVDIASAGVTVHDMEVTGKYRFTTGGITVNSGAVSVAAGGSLTLGSGLIAKGTSSLSGSISGTALTLDTAAMTFKSGNASFTGEVTVKNNASLKVESGANLTVHRFSIHSSQTENNVDGVLVDGGVVNVTSTSVHLHTSDNDALSSGEGAGNGVIIGHWRNGVTEASPTLTAGGCSYLVIRNNGVFNATTSTTVVAWDSQAKLAVLTGSEANLYSINNYTKNASDSRPSMGYVLLAGGRLNIGAGGYSADSGEKSIMKVMVDPDAGASSTPSTLGLMSTTAVTESAPLVVNMDERIDMGAALTIDTEVYTPSSTGKSAASGTYGCLNLTGTLSGTGALTKASGGTLTLNADNSQYTGNITVSGGTLHVAHESALGSGTLTVGASGTLSIADGLSLTLNTGVVPDTVDTTSLGGVKLGAGSTYTLEHAITNIGTLTLAGDATINMSMEPDLLTKLNVTSTFNRTAGDDSYQLTLAFTSPNTSYTSRTTVSDLATGLSAVEGAVNLTFDGTALNRTENSWTAEIGRSTYVWTMSDAGTLSLDVQTSRAMTLVWNSESGSTVWNQASTNQNWNMETTGAGVCFENGDSVRFASSLDATLDGAISADVLRVDDGTTVSLTSATDIDTDSLNVTELRLGSARAEGDAVTAGTQSLTLSGLNTTATDLTVEAGKTSTLTLSGNSTLTVNNAITVDNGGSLTLNSGGRTVSVDAITVNQAGTAVINGSVVGADDGLSSISTGNGSEALNGGSVTITGAVTGSNLAISAGNKGSISITGAVTGVSSITAAAGTETGNGGSVTIAGGVTGSNLAISAGNKGSISITDAVTGVSSITAGENATVSITGNTTGTFTTLTAGEGGGISLTGATITSGGGLTINGNATIGNGADTSTFTANGTLTIASGTTVWKAYREGTGESHNITIYAGATLDAREGVLWRNRGTTPYVGSGKMVVNGTLIVRNLRYSGAANNSITTMGAFHNNAQCFLFGNGATVEVVEGSGFAGGAKDGQGFKLNGTEADNTYTLVFDEGARSNMTMDGGLQAVSGKNHNLVFDVKQNAEVRFAYNVSSAMTGADAPTINLLTTLTKTGAGEMTISNPLSDRNGNFTGTLNVEGGKLTVTAALVPSSMSVSKGATLAFGDSGSTSGTVSVADGGKLAYVGGTHTIENLTFANGAVLDVTNGTSTLNQALDVKRTVTSGANTGNVHIGDGTNKGTLALGANGSLTYDGATYAAKTGSTESSIASTEGKELSLWYSGQTFKGLDITLKSVGTGGDNPREINAVLEDANLKLDGSRAAFTTSREVDTLTLENNSTFYAKGATAKMASATIGAGSEIKSMTQNAAWVGDPEYTIPTTNTNGGTLKNVTLGSAAIAGATEGEGTDMQSLGEITSVSISAVAGMTLSNVTMYDSAITTGATVIYGTNVGAVASTATETPQTRGFGPAASGDSEGDNSATAKELTATTVQTGGKAKGSLTVDVSPTLLSADNAGGNLTWTIFSGVTLGEGDDGFSLLFGSTLKYLMDMGKNVSVEIQDVKTYTGAELVDNINNFHTGDGGLFHIGQSATIILTVENIPEPTTGVLSVLALAALAARRRRSRE